MEITLTKAEDDDDDDHHEKSDVDMGVSKNRGTPKWMLSDGKPN